MPETAAGELVRTRVVVRGRVQGVGFRAATAHAARARGLGGWVRNLDDGAVEAVFEGAPASVEAMATWCEYGPEGAKPRELSRHPESPRGLREFQIR